VSKPSKTRITPEDRPLDVRIFLAAISAGRGVSAALDLSGLSERRVARWIAFCDFGTVVGKAKRKGRRARMDIDGSASLAGLCELNAALSDRLEQRVADRYAGGDREHLSRMRESGELDRIWVREAIDTLRSHGKHALADYHERRLASVLQPRNGDHLTAVEAS
jgi:hypothetical protein